MATTTIAPSAPLTEADCNLVSAWGQGHLTDNEAAQFLHRSPQTIKSRRERLSCKLNIFHGRTDAGHLLIHLIDKQWVKVAAALLLLLAGPLQETTQQLNDDLLRISRTTRKPIRGARRHRRRTNILNIDGHGVRAA